MFVKRDDLFPLAGGGNKARKLQYILHKAQAEGYNAVVTAGDINSNHNRATAIMCAKLGMKAKLIVHNDHPEDESYSVNCFLSRLCNAELIYCSKAVVAETMNQAMLDFSGQGYNPYYVWGGGHCLEAAFAYYDAVKKLKEQITFMPDCVFVASGTGTTQAGIFVGMKHFFPTAKVVGISIARTNPRGQSEVHKSVNELETYLQKPLSESGEIHFADEYVLEGYESVNAEILSCIKDVAQKEGLVLDPTYSGKAFWGMLRYLQEGKRDVLFWNTGGIFNLLSSGMKPA